MSNAEGEFPKSPGFNLFASEVNENITPVGGMVALAKSLSGSISLPSNWEECNGQLISDSDSVYDGVTLPNINGNNQFLRGSTTSGSSGGSVSANFDHDHTVTTVSTGTSGRDYRPLTSASVDEKEMDIDTLPVYYDVVWCIRIK